MTYHLPPDELKQAAEKFSEVKSSAEVFRRAHENDFKAGSNHTMQTISPTLDKALEALESVQWISIDERKPNIGQFALVKRKDHPVTSIDQFRLFPGGYEDFIYNVTHWMPLPNIAKITEAINELKKLKG